MTIHITPEPDFSYVSFESNVASSSYGDLIARVIDTFQPGKFIVTVFANKVSWYAEQWEVEFVPVWMYTVIVITSEREWRRSSVWNYTLVWTKFWTPTFGKFYRAVSEIGRKWLRHLWMLSNLNTSLTPTKQQTTYHFELLPHSHSLNKWCSALFAHFINKHLDDIKICIYSLNSMKLGIEASIMLLNWNYCWCHGNWSGEKQIRAVNPSSSSRSEKATWFVWGCSKLGFL